MTPIFFAFPTQLTHYLTAAKISKKIYELGKFSRERSKVETDTIGFQTLPEEKPYLKLFTDLIALPLVFLFH